MKNIGIRQLDTHPQVAALLERERALMIEAHTLRIALPPLSPAELRQREASALLGDEQQPSAMTPAERDERLRTIQAALGLLRDRLATARQAARGEIRAEFKLPELARRQRHAVALALQALCSRLQEAQDLQDEIEFCEVGDFSTWPGGDKGFYASCLQRLARLGETGVPVDLSLEQLHVAGIVVQAETFV
ncbi:MAG: hypothetical protein H6935_09340 [Thiobacillus sp.]|nr:hypothetical protein [Thiobacillus sp.]